jgi:SMI1 / KNR4 family (SUKH-1)
MHDLTFDKSEKAITQDDVLSVEKSLGVCLPDDFKAHYLSNNGGDIKNAFFVDKSGQLDKIDDIRFISILYNKSFKDDPVFSLPGRIKEEWENAEVPKSLIPFSFAQMGTISAYLCINHQDEKVYFFNRDVDDFKPILIANSFNEFLDKIETAPAEVPVYLAQHAFWGAIINTLNGFSTEKLYEIPYFDEEGFEIYFGEQFDEEGDEIDTVPSKKQLDAYEKTWTEFLQNIDIIIVEIKQISFARYLELYAHYYENKAKSGQEPLQIDNAEKHFEQVKEILDIRVLKNNTLKIAIRYSLDTEHGLELKLKNNKIIAIGGIAET